MLTKNTISYIQSLKQKKYRDEHNTFIAEGIKINTELLAELSPQYIIGLPEVLDKINNISGHKNIIEVTENELTKITQQKSPQGIFCVYHKPESESIPLDYDDLILMLDDIQDPGNLGTIIRLSNWYGIKHIICSKNTADVYAPKVVQSAMGAIVRANVIYCDLESFMQDYKSLPIYGTFLNGKNIYQEPLSRKGIIVMGNEGNGISDKVANYIQRRLYIPPYPAGNNDMESLNVSVATAIICSEFRRRLIV